MAGIVYAPVPGPERLRESFKETERREKMQREGRFAGESLIDLNKPTCELMGCVILFSPAVPTIHHLSVRWGAGPCAIVWVIYREHHRGGSLSFADI